MPEPQLKVALVALNAVGYQSLALGYLQSYAMEHPRLRGKVGFQKLDLTVEVDPWWVAYRALALGADVIGFSVMAWNARSVFDACRIIGTASPDTVLILGGPEVGPIAEDVLRDNPHVDAIVRGEGEATFAELLDTLVRGRRLWMVEGLTARKGDEIVSAADRAPIEDLDEIPSPYLTGVLQPINGGSYLETYRGCPHNCGYCFEGKGFTRIRSFGKDRVAAEIEAIATAPGVETFSFIDPVFNLTPERLRWLSGLLALHAARGTRLHTVEVDIERIDDDAAVLLKDAGVRSVETGPQSVGEEALATCRRAFHPERFRAGVEALKRAGIAVECDLIVGLPGDDAYDFLAGLRFVVDVDPGMLQTSTLHVLPGTLLWEQAGEMGLRFDRTPPHEVVSTTGLSFADLRRSEVLSLALQAAYRARLD